ncbi:MAG: TrkH family potassium uptake protein [Halobacteriota archaeon]|nr:TrkH family potassium uptake protein [Halobacteriota archaeon]
MPSDIGIILRDLGSILTIIGIVMELSLLVPIAFLENDAILGIMIPGLISILCGLSLRFIFKRGKESELRHAMITAAISWFIVAGISSIPFIMVENMSPLSSFFEAMSGWTGTGLTMVDDPGKLTYTIQFWRSLMQWLGGVGVIVLMVSILSRPGTGSFTLYRSEARDEKIHPSVISTVRTIWWIYLLFTIFGIGLFYVAGMSPWEALNHGMTGIATGGFSVISGSIGAYNSPLIELSIIPIMIIGSIPFLIHYKALSGDITAIFKDVQVRAMVVILIGGIVALSAENYLSYRNILVSIRPSVFQFVSALTCTGFQTVDIHGWSPTALIVLSLAMVLGGAAGSTAGGIKIVRAILAYSGVNWWFRRVTISSRAITSFKLGDRLLAEEDANKLVNETTLITLLWILFLFIGVIALLHVIPSAYHLEDVVFEVCSAQGNVGLSTGITNDSMSSFGKVILIFNMWIGRLEIIPVLMLFRSIVKGLGPF